MLTPLHRLPIPHVLGETFPPYPYGVIRTGNEGGAERAWREENRVVKVRG